MIRKVTLLLSAILLVALSGSLIAQSSTPIVAADFIDSTVYNGMYRGVQTQFFMEPNTGNMVVAWYEYFSADAVNPRQTTAATSTDHGATWTVHKQINNGVGAGMNARYASVWGTATTPILAYSDRNPEGTNQNSRPVFATDILGWGGGFFNNTYVDNMDKADTVLYGRYLSVATAPDNDQLAVVGSYHNADPGEALFFYFSNDGGNTWSTPRVPISAISADSGKGNWVSDLSSSGMGVGVGTNNAVMVDGLAQFDDDNDDLWQIVYATSTDGGNSFSSVALIPGTESLSFENSDVYFNFTSPRQDNAGNWHIFAVGTDTLEDSGDFPQKYRVWDFAYDGSTWAIHKFLLPALLDNGLVAWGDYPQDYENQFCNTPTMGPDGTIYYTYSDVVDTTGAGGDVAKFNFNMRVVYSEDNGATWLGPVSILDDWDSDDIQGAAPYADDKLHVVYRDTSDNLYHLGVPTQTIKDLATDIEDRVQVEMPESYNLHQNYPNPFNPLTTIRFDLRSAAHVKLTVYNALGQEVAQLVNEKMTAGYKGIVWNATDMPSGTYFYKLEAGNYSQTKRMILVK